MKTKHGMAILVTTSIGAELKLADAAATTTTGGHRQLQTHDSRQTW
jgi:hypothetical protein